MAGCGIKGILCAFANNVMGVIALKCFDTRVIQSLIDASGQRWKFQVHDISGFFLFYCGSMNFFVNVAVCMKMPKTAQKNFAQFACHKKGADFIELGGWRTA